VCVSVECSWLVEFCVAWSTKKSRWWLSRLRARGTEVLFLGSVVKDDCKTLVLRRLLYTSSHQHEMMHATTLYVIKACKQDAARGAVAVLPGGGASSLLLALCWPMGGASWPMGGSADRMVRSKGLARRGAKPSIRHTTLIITLAFVVRVMRHWRITTLHKRRAAREVRGMHTTTR